MNELFTAIMNKDLAWEMSHFHFHDQYELLFVTGGSCSFLLEAELVHASRGTVILMPSGMLHMSTSLPDDAYTRYVVSMSPDAVRALNTEKTDLLAPFDRSKHYVQLSEEETVRMEGLFKSCVEENDEFGNDLGRRLAFLGILILLGRIGEQEPNEETGQDSEDWKNYLRIKPILAYILDNPAEALSLETVAGKFFYNKHYLCRVFKTATGISVGKYITAVRIQRATMFLREGRSVQESGELAGFKNNSNFISTFRKVMDSSPGQYRQKFRRE